MGYVRISKDKARRSGFKGLGGVMGMEVTKFLYVNVSRYCGCCIGIKRIYGHDSGAMVSSYNEGDISSK